MTTSHFELMIDRGSLDDLPRISSFLEVATVRLAVNPSASFDLQLALEEACTNVFQHSYRGAGGALHISIIPEGSDLVVILEDWGERFDPGAIATPNTQAPLRDRPIGGLGLYLIYHLMDHVSFDFEHGSNRLIMAKRDVLPASPAPTDG